jgi:uncharacterized protein YndB with AHSA1/START domain
MTRSDEIDEIDERYGTLGERDGRGVVRLERRLPATPDEVWPLLVEPEEVAAWLAPLAIEPRVGGAYTLTFERMASVSRGHITAFEPPTLLEYRWFEGEAIESTVRVELRAAGAGATDLILTHTLLRGATDLHAYAAGWHAHLDLLGARLAGRAAEWDPARYDHLLAAYAGTAEGDARASGAMARPGGGGVARCPPPPTTDERSAGGRAGREE